LPIVEGEFMALSAAPSAAHGSGRFSAVLRRIDPYVLLVILLPFAVLTYYRSWLITFPSALDAWYSVSYFLDLPGSLRVASDYYASNRLAYWIPGSVVFHLLPPLAANYVLHLAYYLAATLALYVTVSHTLGRKTALAATFLLGGYWHFLTEIGWNYVDGVGVAYTLLAAASLTLAARGPRRPLGMLAAGVWFAAAVNTNLFLLETAIPLALYHVGACRIRGSMRRLGWDLACFVAGAVGLTALLGAYFYAVTGKLLLASSVTFAWGMAQAGPGHSTVGGIGYQLPHFTQWIKRERSLEIPLVVLAGTALYLGGLVALRWTRNKPALNPFATLFQRVYLVHFALFAACELRGIHMLAISWYAIYLVPLMILALAGQLSRSLESLRHGTVGVLSVAGLWLTSDLFLLRPSQSLGMLQTLGQHTLYSHPRAILLQLGLLGAVGGAMLAGFTRRGQLKAATLALVLAGIAVFNSTRGSDSADWPRYRLLSYEALFDGIDAIRREGVSVRSVQFWYNKDGPLGATAFRSLNAAYLWGYSLYGLDYPDLPHGDAKPIPPFRPVLAVLTERPGAFETARDRLRAANIDAHLLREQRIQRGDIVYTLTLMRCGPLPTPSPVGEGRP
jgi:hypothetical protein